MKLIIKNFNIESNIYISRLNSGEEIDIYYKDLNITNDTVTVDTYEFKNGIYRIEISEAQPLEIELIYKFYNNNNKLIYEIRSFDCCVVIKDDQIYSYDDEKFIEQFEVKLEDIKLCLINHWNLYWHYLHWLTYNYPNNPTNEDKEEIIKLINVMKTDGIRCEKCLKHFNEWLDENDIIIALSNNISLFKYFFDLHNNINKNKQKKIFSIKKAINIYKNKDWNKEFMKYDVNIVNLFNKRKLEIFPILFYTIIKNKLMKEYNLD